MNNLRVSGFLFLISCLELNAQYDTHKIKPIDRVVNKIELAKGNPLRSFKINFDSIDVSVVKFQSKIETTCIFKISNSHLVINYYLKGKDLIKVSVSEISPLQINESNNYHYTGFYFKKGKIISQFNRYTLTEGIQFPKDSDFEELYRYNKHLNADFIKTFILDLFEKIKNFR